MSRDFKPTRPDLLDNRSDDPPIPMDHPMWYTSDIPVPPLPGPKPTWLERLVFWILRVQP